MRWTRSGSAKSFLFRWHRLILILQARQQRELEEAEQEEERAARAAQELEEQIQADAMRQAMAKEQQYKTRKRANSETTEVPQMFDVDTPTERFHDMEMNGVKFNSVKLFHPRSGKPLCAVISTHFDDFSSMSRIDVHGGACRRRYHLCHSP